MIYNDRYILKTGHSLLAPIYEPPLITHNHTFFEFSFIRRGHCTNVINNIRYPIARGICTLLRPSDCHFFDDVMPTNPKKYEHIDVYVFQDPFKSCCDVIDSQLYDDILQSEKPIVFNVSNALLESLDNKIDYLINNQSSELAYNFHKIIIVSLLGAYLEEKGLINHNYPQWLNDLLADLNTIDAISSNITALAEKYGYMMMWTSPKEFKEVRDLLPQVTDEKKGRVLRIAAIHMDWQKEIAKKYPALSQKGRRITQDGSADTAFETYLKGELLTYSEATLALYEAYLMGCLEKDVNLNEEILRATVHAYGYDSLRDAEEKLSH